MTPIDSLRHVEAILTERGPQHGADSVAQLLHVQQIKRAIGHYDAPDLTLTEREAMDNIAMRLSRLVDGTPSIAAWEDVIGYAAIALAARSMVPLPSEESTD